MSNEYRIKAIAEWLDKQVVDSSITDGTIWEALKLSKTSFYRLKGKAQQLQSRLAKQRQQVIDDTNTQAAIEAAKNGLKSKIDRVLHLQKQVEDIQKDIDDNIMVDYAVIGGRMQKVNKEMNAQEKGYLRKVMKDIQAEISKIEGDYAPEKRAMTDSKGQDVPQLVFMSVENMSDAMLEKLTKNDASTNN